MSSHNCLLHPIKRWRTKQNDILHEDDAEAHDAVTVEHITTHITKGAVETQKFVLITPVYGIENNDNNDSNERHNIQDSLQFEEDTMDSLPSAMPQDHQKARENPV